MVHMGLWNLVRSAGKQPSPEERVPPSSGSVSRTLSTEGEFQPESANLAALSLIEGKDHTFLLIVSFKKSSPKSLKNRFLPRVPPRELLIVYEMRSHI